MRRGAKSIVLRIILFCFMCAFAFAAPIVLADTAQISDQTPEAEPRADIRYGVTNAKGINVRKKPGAKAIVVGRLPITGTAVRIFEEVRDGNQIVWYRVDVEDKRLEGYIRSDLIDEVTADEYAEHVDKSRTRQTAGSASSNSSSPVLKLQSIPSTHSAYPGTTTVWIENGVYHSDQACPNIENGDVTTLQTAQGRGLTPCGLCWCLDCLFGG